MKMKWMACLLLTVPMLIHGCGSGSDAKPPMPAAAPVPQAPLSGKDTLLRSLTESYATGLVWDDAMELAKLADPSTIPVMIGIIDADNSYDTVYGVGYFGLGYDTMGTLTGVEYSPYHDGAWWRRWWATNKSRFPKDVQDIPIPDLPKTGNGKHYVPFPESLDTLDGKLAWLKDHLLRGETEELSRMPMEISKHGDPKAIPLLIGVIDADNSYDTIYGVGYFGLGFGQLGEVTGVRYSPYHDGAWWRRWWEANKSRFPQDVQNIPIPEFPKTESVKNHVPFPESLDTLDGKLAWLSDLFKKGELDELHDIASGISQHDDPRAIPLLIGVIDADNSPATIDAIGRFALGRGPLGERIGVDYSPHHDGAWWRRWWEANKSQFAKEVQDMPIPDLPKTEYGKKHVPFPESLDTLDGKLAELRKAYEKNGARTAPGLVQEIARAGDPKAIPLLIGIIDADNSYDTVYGIGYFGLGYDRLGEVTGVRYSPYHDGAWWRRWWEANKSQFPKEVQDMPIPDLPKTENGTKHIPFPESLDTLDGKLAWLKDNFERGTFNQVGLWGIAREIAQEGDPRAIPLLIGVIDADNTYDTVYGIGYYALGVDKLGEITGVRYHESHDGAWWRSWWEENKSRFAQDVQNLPIPNVSKTSRRQASDDRQADVEPELAGVPSQEFNASGNGNMRYFLIGPKDNAQPPEAGFKLAVVLPGGDGGADFNPFVRRILKNALKPDWIVAEPVAFKWKPNQVIVWPTEINRVDGQQFSTETFVESVIADVKGRFPVDTDHIVTLSWSSSGPAAYAIGLQPTTTVTGSYIAMSVFKPDQLPTLSNAKGRRYHIEHSPEDQVCPYPLAQSARDQLTKVGAIVHSTDYEGGHGWRGDVYGRIREGMEWLTTR